MLVASAITAVCRLLTKSDALSVTLGTLTMPALIFAALVYWVITMEADDAPPGMVLIGNMTVIAVVTPIALLASRLTTRLLSRRASKRLS